MELKFNEGSMVEYYMNKHRLYDRFLPYLAPYLEGTVIDVGANCGVLSTTMSMANPNLTFLCIEPEEKYLEILYENIKQAKNKIDVQQGKIGKEFLHLDKVIERFGITNIGLLKVDVDGFDWDVLDTYSFDEKPPIYMEEDFKEPWQYPKYYEINHKLEQQGYNHIFMFDNFGCFIGYSQDWKVVNMMNSYFDRMKSGKSDQTIWYMDLLICQDKNADWLKQAVYMYSTI